MAEIDKSIKTLISSHGYEFNSDEDSDILALCKEMTLQQILNSCNIEKMPHELDYVFVRRVAGEFLSMKLASGYNFIQIDDYSAVKTLTEGDTTITKFEGASEFERLRRLFNDLKRYGEKELVRFRKLCW